LDRRRDAPARRAFLCCLLRFPLSLLPHCSLLACLPLPAIHPTGLSAAVCVRCYRLLAIPVTAGGYSADLAAGDPVLTVLRWATATTVKGRLDALLFLRVRLRFVRVLAFLHFAGGRAVGARRHPPYPQRQLPPAVPLFRFRAGGGGCPRLRDGWRAFSPCGFIPGALTRLRLRMDADRLARLRLPLLVYRFLSSLAVARRLSYAFCFVCGTCVTTFELLDCLPAPPAALMVLLFISYLARSGVNVHVVSS